MHVKPEAREGKARFRAALEMLAIPLPEYARRKETGRPTTTKLINAYAEMDAQPVQGGNIQSAKKEIEK